MQTGDLIRSPNTTYQILRPFRLDGEIYDTYLGIKAGDPKKRALTIKIAGDPSLNHFADNEFKVLTQLNASSTSLSKGNKLLIPEPLETFEIEQDNRAVVVTDHALNYFTLEQIKKQYPDGVPPQHVAWIFRRMLAAIISAHIGDVIHGKILPWHMIIYSGDKHDDMRHTGVLTDWTYAVRKSADNTWPSLPLIPTEYRRFYPPEILRGERPSPQSDLAMIAKCAIYLLDGDVESGDAFEKVGKAKGMANLLQACCSPNIGQRPRNLTGFDTQFQAMLVPYFGPPKFVELKLTPLLVE